ncbi:hypothetical protein NLG97_g5726 [Lecanicillium saksenae]|uniref:Uncharacterized protein n=1 Tax=Lecanicillium saksenae TaxID=468837 RepID=A0ACC1QRT9_9HYPO|nr:hypothetical protein NLG97_g5726 [Lecanicillium saksenae]
MRSTYSLDVLRSVRTASLCFVCLFCLFSRPALRYPSTKTTTTHPGASLETKSGLCCYPATLLLLLLPKEVGYFSRYHQVPNIPHPPLSPTPPPSSGEPTYFSSKPAAAPRCTKARHLTAGTQPSILVQVPPRHAAVLLSPLVPLPPRLHLSLFLHPVRRSLVVALSRLQRPASPIPHSSSIPNTLPSLHQRPPPQPPSALHRTPALPITTPQKTNITNLDIHHFADLSVDIHSITIPAYLSTQQPSAHAAALRLTDYGDIPRTVLSSRHLTHYQSPPRRKHTAIGYLDKPPPDHWPRDSFPRHQSFSHQCFTQDQPDRHNSFSAERYGHEMQTQNSFHEERYQISPQNGRFPEPNDPTRRPQFSDIDEALRRQCGVPVRRYFIAAAADDGTPSTLVSGGHKLPEAVIAQFFDASKFQQVMHRVETGKPISIFASPSAAADIRLGADPMLDDTFNQEEPAFNRQIFNQRRAADRRRSSAFGDWGSPARSGRKRPRPRNPLNEDEDTPMTVSSRRGIKIGDSDAVWTFYEQRFKNCQQTACKLIAKAWVKAVEPKKQSTHPYTGSDEKAPDWWPKPWGPTKDDKVRHKEPDHLYKRERVHLLAHILRIVLEPNSKQHPDIRKLGLNVTKLEETTAEALSSFFMDNDANARKKPFLTEIFKVARQEERYKNGEIDGTTEIYVMAEDKVPESYVSENDDVGSFMKDEEDVEPSAKPTPTMGGAMRPSVRTDAATLSGLPGDAFIGELPMRGSQFQPPMMNDMASQHTFVDNGSMVHGQAGVSATGSSLTLDIGQSPHAISRRQSVFSDFPSPGENMYPQQWQASSNGTNGSPMYAYATQQSNMETGAFVSPGVAMDPNQSFMTTSFEEGPRPNYNTGQAGMFRQDDMPPGSVAPATGYNYVTNDGRGMMPQVVDGANRTPMH